MSSIVRKSQFTPKVKKAVRIKKTVDVLTPASTQAPESPLLSQPDGPITPQATQPIEDPAKPSATFNFALNKQAPEIPHEPVIEEEEDIDPKDTSRQLLAATHENQQPDYSDTFKKPSDRLGSISVAPRRRSSVKLQKRLSGIAPHTASTRRTSSVMSEDAEPIRIGIPNTRGAKRRRSSVASARRGSSIVDSSAPPERPAKSTAIAVPSQRSEEPAVVAPERDPNSLPFASEAEIEEQNDLLKIHAEDKHENPKIDDDDEFVVGLNPAGNTLVKYRRRTEENKDEQPTEEQLLNPNYVPVAPANLERRITGIKQIPKKIDQQDYKLFAQINITPEEFSMADLCKPSFAIGDVSENFDKAISAQAIIEERKVTRRKAREYARQYRVSFEEALLLVSSDTSDTAAPVVENKIDFLKDDEPEESKASGIQIKVVNGQMQVDNQSTFVPRDPKLLDRSQEATEVNPFADPIISSSYTKRRHTDKWTSDELLVFYNALSTWGTDFSFIAQLFPYRTRKQIKLKFNSEERKFPEIVSLALKRKLPSDFEKYCQQTNKQIESMEFYEEELKLLRLEHEQHIAEINKEKEKAIQDDKEANRKREYEIRTGSKMTRAEKQREFRKNEQVIGSIDEVKKKREEMDNE